MTTTGDRFLGQPLSEIGGKGLFTKELEEALLANEIDFAVHSAKDMQTVLPAGLVMPCVLEREDVRDLLIGAASLQALPAGARVGTSSLRRGAQVLHARPDINIVPLRGNVQTRLAKLEAGEADATLLAVAGVKRLGMQPLPGTPISIDEILPAVAQGALAIECREGDANTHALLAPLHHAPSFAAITAERAMLAVLDGNCRTPIAGLAEVQGDQLNLRAMLLSADGKQVQQTRLEGSVNDAARIGKEAGEFLKKNFA
jgi:hydroxymethylbilane synthase